MQVFWENGYDGAERADDLINCPGDQVGSSRR
jgi:hypothetical protein